MSEPVVSRRVKAAIAAGALAFSVAAPGIAAAQEPDRQQEGVVAPEQSLGTAPEQQSGEGAADEPSFEPGGDDALPFELEAPEPAPPADQDADYAAPMEPEPVHDPYADYLAPDQSDSEASPSDEAALPPVEPAPDVPTAPSSDAVTVESPTTEAETPATPDELEPAEPPHDSNSSDTSKTQGETTRRPEPKESAERKTRPGSAPGVPLPQVAPVSSLAPAAGGQPVTPSPATPSATSSYTTLASNSVVSVAGSASTRETTGAASKDARVHIVRPGESLWSIAKKLLGPSATPAEIAREVNRLWELNKDRIGTGNPDLLMAGTKLRLR
jgi:hypothetical protein